MHIEEYTTYQESEVLALYGSVGWTAYTEQPEALRRGFAGSLLTLAARENGTLVGLLRAVGDGCTVVLVQDLLVRPDHQRRGIGTALMEHCIRYTEKVGFLQLELDVVADNESAVKLCKRHGFVEFGRNPLGFRRRDGSWQELILMRRELPQK